MLTALVALGTTLLDGVVQHFKGKQDIQKAITENKIRLALSDQSHNHEWEMAQLADRGWKDDVLFYAFLAMFVWAGFKPETAKEFFANLSILPEWFVETWMWLVASIVGVKKIGEYLPSALNGIKQVLTKKGE